MFFIRLLMGSILGVTLLTIAGIWVYEHNMPGCESQHLKIYPLAVAYPGMSQTHAAYAIVNRGEHACRIPKMPYFEPHTSKDHQDTITLKPIPSSSNPTWKEITWFSVHANGACSQILNTLPKQIPLYFSNGLALKLPTIGYPCQPHIGKPLSTGLKAWTQARQCYRKSHGKPFGKHILLSDQQNIDFGETLTCD
ncbi:MAG: hypothetical protein CL816_04790 [Coxiellaceae bacterium]|nr:hypothetical protein [Coxiellaceae bacterium]|tara:strand:+ start:573 stop:1157 length:585 start_codon:yes stop_codon:yes gene_type:complete